jgi:rhodanese-related sulfurtransferase
MKTSLLVSLICALSFGGTGRLAAITPADLQKKLQAGEKLTVIDVRGTAFFQKGHIPGAINVPASILADKKLPPLGAVVAYDDGLGDNLAAAAVAALNRKNGIRAEALEGGFAAWENARAETTRAPGLSREEVPQISYAKLKAAPADDLVLVDLRQPAQGPTAKSVKDLAAPEWTDLSAQFPGAAVTRSPFRLPATRKAAAAGPPLLVLIDNNDGAAEQVARVLKANGVKRFVILTGGEDTLLRKGQPGLERAGTIMSLPKPVVSPATTPNQ